MRHTYRRPAFTLLELMLVLALLTTMAAMTWPMLHGALARQRLYSAAEEIRAVWLRTRVDAMTSGLVHIFRYEPNEGRYWVEMWDGPNADLESTGTGGMGAATGEQENGLPKGTRTLPQGVSFLGGSQDASARDEQFAAQAGEQGAGERAVGILFYPDGTTSNVESFGVGNQDNRTLTLSMHGLTGIVSMTTGHPAEAGQ